MSLRNAGMEIESTVTCVSDPETCQDGVQLLLSPVTTGVTLLFLVETTNHSAGGGGAFRREFYPTQVRGAGPTRIVSAPG